MACGTGKTFTALRIAEEIVPADGTVLFLVPSLALLSQTLREWSNQTLLSSFHPIAVCSDKKVSEDEEDISPAAVLIVVTTNKDELVREFKPNKFNVIFATYHSIEVVIDAQKQGLPEIDLTICDEAHRTTGAELPKKEKSYFLMVHDNKHLRSRKRLYMTATPRVYKETSETTGGRKRHYPVLYG